MTSHYACLYASGNPTLLLECASRFSPLIEQTSQDAVIFDVEGMGRLYPTPRHLAEAIIAQAGIPVSLGLASNPDAAWHAARGFRGITVLPPGEEAKGLAPLPLNLLGGSPQTAETLYIWGIRTFGEFAALPPMGVAARLGQEGVELQRLARGEGYRRLRLLEDALHFEDEIELDDPVELLEPLSFVLSRLLNDLCARLNARSLATTEIRLRLTLELAPHHEATLRLPVPMRDPKAFLKMLQLELGSRPPGAPVVKVKLALEPVRPRTEQQGLFIPLSPEPEKLELTLARIRSLVGPDKAGTPEILDTHRPDSFRLVALGVGQAVSPATGAPAAPPLRQCSQMVGQAVSPAAGAPAAPPLRQCSQMVGQAVSPATGAPAPPPLWQCSQMVGQAVSSATGAPALPPLWQCSQKVGQAVSPATGAPAAPPLWQCSQKVGQAVSSATGAPAPPPLWQCSQKVGQAVSPATGAPALPPLWQCSQKVGQAVSPATGAPAPPPLWQCSQKVGQAVSPATAEPAAPPLWQCSQKVGQAVSPATAAPRTYMALRRFRPPQFAQVRLQGGRPVHVSSLTMKGPVLSCAGPWRTAGEWWKPDPWAHDEWDVALGDGGVFRLHRELPTDRWFFEGRYD